SRQPPAAPTRSRDNRRRLSQAAEKRSLNLQVSSFKSQLPRIWPDFGGSDLSLVTLNFRLLAFSATCQTRSGIVKKRALLLLGVASMAAVPARVFAQRPEYPITVIAPGKGPYAFP